MSHEMNIIASTGGKGGVGKSTFALLLAFKYAKQEKKIVLFDADVECPNDAVLIGEELANPQTIYKEFPKLNKEKCVKCGKCDKVCRENAIFWVEDDYPNFLFDLCTGCGACWYACPSDAINTEEKSVGTSYLNKINENFWLVTGESNTGVAETGLIVGEAKKRAVKLAREKRADYLIIDTAPGIHCNVINALLNVEKAYTITEPTPLGVHDLKIILQLLKRLEIPSEVVLNMAGIGDKKQVQKLAKEFDTKISIEIPYSKKLVRAYASKKLDTMVHLL